MTVTDSGGGNARRTDFAKGSYGTRGRTLKISVSFGDETFRAIQAESARRGVSASMVVREWVAAGRAAQAIAKAKARASWTDRMIGLRDALGREPTLEEMLACAATYQVTDAEKEAQRQSFARAMAPCEHGVPDFEQCPACRQVARDGN